jgi:PAS domain S-box-containing protein
MREILEPIAHQLQSSQELDRVLAVVARDVAGRFEAPCARIWLIRRGDVCQACRWAPDCQDKRRCLHLKANFGANVDSAFRRTPLDVFANEAIARGGIIHWSDAPRETSFLLDPAWAEERGVVAMAVHPLRVENRVLGLLAVFGTKHFSPEDYETCAIYAATASTAIRVAELANRAQRAETSSREKTKEAHQTSRLLNAVLNNSVENAIVVEDLDGNIVAFNEGARRMYGHEPTEIVGTANAEKLYAPEEWASGRVMEMYRTTLEQGSFTGILQRIRKDGELFQEQATVAALRDDDGDPAGFVIVSYEMSRALPASAPGADGPLTTAIEAALSVRRVEQLPTEIVKQLCGLAAAEAGVLLFLEGSALAAKAIAGDGVAAGWAETRFLPAEAPELFRALENGQAAEVSVGVRDRLFPESSLKTATAVPLVRNGALGLAVLLSGGTVDESVKATALRFARLTSSALDWTLLIEQTNEQLRHLQNSYSGQDLEVRQSAERIGTLERSLEAASKSAARAEKLAAENTELIARLEALEGELFEVQAQLGQTGGPEMAERFAQIEAALQASEAGRAQAQSLLDEVQSHYELSHRHLSDRNAQLENMLAESQREIADRDYRLHEFQATVKTLNDRVANAEASANLSEEHFEALKQDAAANQRLLEETRQELLLAKVGSSRASEEMGLLRSDFEISQRLLTEAVEARRAVEAALQERDREVARISAENEMLRETIEDQASSQRLFAGAEVERLTAEIESFERRHLIREALLATVMQRLETLTRERSAWQAIIDQAEVREAEFHQRQATVTELEREVSQLRQGNARQGTEVASLRQKLMLAQNSYREALNLLQSRLEDLAKLSAISGAYQKLEDALTIAVEPEPVEPPAEGRRMVIACDDADARKQLAHWAREIGCQAQFVENGDAMLSTLTIDPPDIVLLDLVDPEFDGLELHRRMRRNPDWRALPVVLVMADGEIGRLGMSPSPTTTMVARGHLSPEILRGLVAQTHVAHA